MEDGRCLLFSKCTATRRFGHSPTSVRAITHMCVLSVYSLHHHDGRCRPSQEQVDSAPSQEVEEGEEEEEENGTAGTGAAAGSSSSKKKKKKKKKKATAAAAAEGDAASAAGGETLSSLPYPLLRYYDTYVHV